MLLPLAGAGSCGGAGEPPGEPGAPHCPGVAASQAFLRLPARDPELRRDFSSTSLGPKRRPGAGFRPVSNLRSSNGVSEDNLRGWVELLAAPELRGRHAASAESRAVAALLAEQLAALRLSSPYPEGSFCQSFPILGTRGQNAIAHLSGAPAGAQRPVVLLGAHYDGQGVHPAGSAFPSADDNASGVAALLEVARLAQLRRAQWNVDLVFAAFGAEEIGQMGSHAYVAEPSVPLSHILLMINLDMVGRPLPGEQADGIGFLALGSEAERVRAMLERAAATAGIAVRDLADLGDASSVRSDASVFSPLVPTLFLSTGSHGDQHQLTDTPDRLDYEQVARAAKLVLTLLSEVTS